MEQLKNTKFLEFHPDTLQTVRSRYGLDKHGQMDEAIDALENWVHKQQHFIKKDFSRDYLERAIMARKGSVERAKIDLDKLCTFKTTMPQFFGDFALEVIAEMKDKYYACFLPKLTPDHKRVIIVKFDDCKMDSYILPILRMAFAAAEYLKAHDYNDGFILILDYLDTSITELLTKFDPINARDGFAVLLQGYAGRLAHAHFISKTKIFNIFTILITQLISKKISDRLHFHSSREELYKFIPKDILPANYGGYEKSSKELHDMEEQEFMSDENRKYRREMFEACTDESLRQINVLNEQSMGLPGTFRSLNVD